MYQSADQQSTEIRSPICSADMEQRFTLKTATKLLLGSRSGFTQRNKEHFDSVRYLRYLTELNLDVFAVLCDAMQMSLQDISTGKEIQNSMDRKRGR